MDVEGLVAAWGDHKEQKESISDQSVSDRVETERSARREGTLNEDPADRLETTSRYPMYGALSIVTRRRVGGEES